MDTSVDLYIMALCYILAGSNHFLNPKLYLRIIPPVLPWKQLINSFTGIAEIFLGILLVTSWQVYAAWGIIVLLFLIFPANVYHLMLRGAGLRVPVWLLWIRLPLQGVLIWWASLYL